MHRARGWLAILLPLLAGATTVGAAITRAKPGVHDLGSGGPQFSYGIDYCLWLQDLPHNPENPYDDLGGEA